MGERLGGYFVWGQEDDTLWLESSGDWLGDLLE